MKHLSMFLFGLLSAIHLYHSYIDDKKARKLTKPFLILSLLLYYITASHHPNPVLIGALITSWLGDILLIPSGNRWFIAGGISFLIAHILFVTLYFQGITLRPLPWLLIIPALLTYMLISGIIIWKIKNNTPKLMILPMYLYLGANSIMNISALLLALSRHNLSGNIALIGAVSFFISDAVLYLVRYHPNRDLVPGKHFTVMTTYLLAEFLITLGGLIAEK